MKVSRHLFSGLLLAASLALPASSVWAADLITCAVAGTTHTYGEPFSITNDTRGLDDSSQRIDNLGAIFPGGIKFQNTTYTQLYLNINGNVSFGAAQSTYTPIAIPGLSYPILAPFFADVDLRPGSPAGIYTCRDVANKRLIFTWNEVGYYNQQTNKRNSFQLVMTNSSDQCQDPRVTSAFDVQFRYKKLEWTTGDASSGSNGLGGTPATAGIDAGDTRNAVALPGSGSAAVLNLVSLGNTEETGVFEFRVADGTMPSCGDGVAGLCEQCDLGGDNGPDSACTQLCVLATCGDGLLHVGVEECDGTRFDPSYRTCPPGYTGQPVCNNDPANPLGDGTCTASTASCQDIDECQQNPNLCPNGTCVNTPGSFHCVCDTGFELNAQGACVNIDECARGLDNCDPNATCTDTEGSFTCTCNPGFHGNGVTCSDIDYCADPARNNCDENATCTNVPAGFTCTCDTGYQGDGVSCEDIDECADSTLNTCDPNAVCTNTPGGHTCACEPGFEGDGLDCTDIDECADPTLNDCHEFATCTNTPGGYTCACEPGYVGDGRVCGERECTPDEVAQCGESNGCAVNGEVIECACKPGYGPGLNGACEDIDECAAPELNTCDANATCINTAGGYACVCDDGFRGDGRSCAPRGDEDTGLISGGGLMSCASSAATPADSPLTFVLVALGGFVVLRRRARG